MQTITLSHFSIYVNLTAPPIVTAIAIARNAQRRPICERPLRGVYSDTTQLNSTDPVEQRTAKSVVFLFMTSRPTN